MLPYSSNRTQIKFHQGCDVEMATVPEDQGPVSSTHTAALSLLSVTLVGGAQTSSSSLPGQACL